MISPTAEFAASLLMVQSTELYFTYQLSVVRVAVPGSVIRTLPLCCVRTSIYRPFDVGEVLHRGRFLPSFLSVTFIYQDVSYHKKGETIERENCRRHFLSLSFLYFVYINNECLQKRRPHLETRAP